MTSGFLSAKTFSTLSWLLLLAAMAGLAGVGYELYQRHILPDEPQEFYFGSVEKSEQLSRVALTEIIKAHIFGVVPIAKKPKVEKPRVVETPETKLNLSLTGIIAASNPLHRRALIEIKRGQTTVVQVGTEIGETGATLNAVFSDHILIERRGKLEKLVFKRESLKLSNPEVQNSQTISALNINVAEFEALATVNPSDLDISKLLPPVATGGLNESDSDDEPENIEHESEEESQSRQPTQVQQLLPKVDSSGRALRKTVPGGLKSI